MAKSEYDNQYVEPKTICGKTITGVVTNVLVDATGVVQTNATISSATVSIESAAVDTSWIYDLVPVRFDRVDNSAIGEIGLIAEHVEQVRGSICCYDQKRNLVSYSKSELIIPLLNELILLEQRVSQLEDPHRIKDKVESLKEKIFKGKEPQEGKPIVVKEWIPHDPEPEREPDVQFVPPILGPRDPEPAGD